MFEFIIILAVLIIIGLYLLKKWLTHYAEKISTEERISNIKQDLLDRQERQTRYEAGRKKRLGTKNAIDEFLDSEL
jgi:hypothetical protein